MAASSASKPAILAMLALAVLGAAPDPPAPRFEGKSIPDPPRQKEPWTPPPTKLPRFLVSATTALFDQGVPDPRGCEYREVELGDARIVKTRGFVYPPRQDEIGRFVITWDGVIYPAISVGAGVDLEKDVRAMIEAAGRNRQAAAGAPFHSGRFPGARPGWFVQRGLMAVAAWSPWKVCLLLRLGRADLAESLFAAGTPWTPAIRGLDLTDYGISYLTLAGDWASEVFVRLVDAHRRGDDAIALDAARRLSAFAAAVEARAEAMGFERPQQQMGGPRLYFPFLRQLSDLLADQERRAAEPPRGPIPPPGGDPTARVAALIRDLDQIEPPGMMNGPVIMNGGASPLGSSLERDLIAEGDAAVGPLLDALETDRRLTRTVSLDRGMSIGRHVHPVAEVELAALIAILRTNEFNQARWQLRWADLEARQHLARSIRAYWMKNRALSMNERWYRMLGDDSAGPDRWTEAALGIVQPKDGRAFGAVGYSRMARPETSPMAGEELRPRRDPGVSEWLARRVAEMARAAAGNTFPHASLHHACSLAIVFDRWDEKAAAPAIRTAMARCLEVLERDRESNDHTGRARATSRYLAGLTLIRAQAGDRASLREYAAWARRITPQEMKDQDVECLEPLWKYPDDPAIREAARSLFADPRSPWITVLRDPESHPDLFSRHQNLYASPLLGSPSFREGLRAAMANRSPMGTIRRIAVTIFGLKLPRGTSESFFADRREPDLPRVGEDRPFRVCDFIAWKVSSIPGAPRCELYWPEERRDQAVEACLEFLEEYGGDPGGKPRP